MEVLRLPLGSRNDLRWKLSTLLWALNTNAYVEKRRNKGLRCDVRVLTAVLNILVRFTITSARHLFVTERNPCAKLLEFLNQAAGWFLNRFISKHSANSELPVFLTLSIVWYSKNLRTTFRKLNLFPSSVGKQIQFPERCVS
jgi:hypothetical protein